jgi:hypothetical protein
MGDVAVPIDDDDDDEGDWEDWAEPEVAPTRCIFTERVFESAAECLAHANEIYGLDLASVAKRCAIAQERRLGQAECLTPTTTIPVGVPERNALVIFLLSHPEDERAPRLHAGTSWTSTGE